MLASPASAWIIFLNPHYSAINNQYQLSIRISASFSLPSEYLTLYNAIINESFLKKMAIYYGIIRIRGLNINITKIIYSV